MRAIDEARLNPAPDIPPRHGADRAARRALLRLACGGAVDPEAMPPEDWPVIAALAARQRLEPLLHVRLRDCAAVPSLLRETWRTAHRDAALKALAGKADLRHAAGILRPLGIEPLLLKGSSLAWHAYPEPAQRPMRDIDLLVPADRFRESHDALLRAGYTPEWPAETSLEEIERTDKSPPPLRAPMGTAIELHLHAWFPPGHLEWFCPSPDDAGMFARAWRDADGLMHPSAYDMIRHLVIHAVFSHRLDCGAQVLVDLHQVIRKDSVDWPALWHSARAEGWADAARLLFELLETSGGPPVPLAGAAPPAPGAALLSVATDLLFQDLETRKTASILARVGRDGWRGIAQRIAGRVRKSQHVDLAERAGPPGLGGWAMRRLGETVREAARRSTRDQARGLAALSRWIDASAPARPRDGPPD